MKVYLLEIRERGCGVASSRRLPLHEGEEPAFEYHAQEMAKELARDVTNGKSRAKLPDKEAE